MTHHPLKGTLLSAAASLRTLARENQALRKEAASLRKLEKVAVAIQVLIDRGRITQPAEVLTKQAELMQLSEEDLTVLTKAAQLEAPAFADVARPGDEPDAEGSLDATNRFIATLFR